jgi:hypothetical protein
MFVDFESNEVVFKLHEAMQKDKHYVIEQVGWYNFVPFVHSLPWVTPLSSTSHIFHHFAEHLAKHFYDFFSNKWV